MQTAKYLKEIKNYLTCPEEENGNFLKSWKAALTNFWQITPRHRGRSCPSLWSPAGSQSFLQEEDFKEVQEKIRLKGRVIRILSVAILVLTAAAVILGGIFVIDTFSFNHGQYKESIGKGSGRRIPPFFKPTERGIPAPPLLPAAARWRVDGAAFPSYRLFSI